MYKLNKIMILMLLMLLLSLPKCVWAEGAYKKIPRNIRIEVEFKEYGETKKGVSSLAWRDTKRSSYTKQFIVVSDGLSASIFVGEKVPYVNYYVTFLRDGGYIETDVAIKEVGTKLQVSPRIMGDDIEVALTPQITFISDKKRQTIDIKTLTTTVIVRNGHSVSIGGLLKDTDFERYFLSSSSKSNLDIILTPHIE